MTDAAVAYGIHISAQPPLGYRRKEDRRLEPDPATADAVREAFKLRAGGASHGEIVEHLAKALGKAPAKSAVTGMLRNRVYLGEAPGGPNGAVNPTAHEPLVDEETFLRIQAERGAQPSDRCGRLKPSCAGCSGAQPADTSSAS